MSVMKEDGTRRLINQILASLKIGKYAIMDKALNINSKNPVENKVITQAINGLIETRPQVIAERGSSYAVLDNVKFITYQKNVSLSMSPQGINWVKVTDLNTDLFPPSVTHSTNWLVFANISNQNGNAIIISARLDKAINWEVWISLYNPSSAIDLTMTVDLMIVDVREV